MRALRRALEGCLHPIVPRPAIILLEADVVVAPARDNFDGMRLHCYRWGRLAVPAEVCPAAGPPGRCGPRFLIHGAPAGCGAKFVLQAPSAGPVPPAICPPREVQAPHAPLLYDLVQRAPVVPRTWTSREPSCRDTTHGDDVSIPPREIHFWLHPVVRGYQTPYNRAPS